MENQAYVDFCNAISELQNPAKNRKVTVKSDKGSYTFEYADLASIMDIIRPVFLKNRLALVQPVSSDGQTVIVTTKIIHASGEVIQETTMSGKVPGRIQDLGGLITYLRRYALSSLVGIAADEDDDGNQYSDQPRKVEARQPARQAPPQAKTQPAEPGGKKAVSKEEILKELHLHAAAVTLPMPALEEFIMNKMSKTLDELTVPQIANILGRLNDPEIQKQIHALSAGDGQLGD